MKLGGRHLWEADIYDPMVFDARLFPCGDRAVRATRNGISAGAGDPAHRTLLATQHDDREVLPIRWLSTGRRGRNPREPDTTVAEDFFFCNDCDWAIYVGQVDLSELGALEDVSRQLLAAGGAIRRPTRGL